MVASCRNFKKKKLEYSFTNRSRKGTTRIRLGDYDFEVKQNDRVESISYASVFSVRMNRERDHVYCLYVHSDGKRPIEITSLAASGQQANQEYSMFVRVLHHHLMEKSRATFLSGCNRGILVNRVLLVGLISVVISLTAHAAGFSWMNPILQAMLAMLLTGTVFLLFSLRNLPREYVPAEIPLQYLP